MASWLRALLLVVAVITASAVEDPTEALASNLNKRESLLLERLKSMLQVPKDDISLAQTADSVSSTAASTEHTSELVPLPDESLGDVYFRGQLQVQEENRKKQEAEMTRRAQEAALAAAHQQAYMDALAFQQQAVLLQQAARARWHRHHRRHRHHSKRHHRRSKHHREAPTPSFLQQYYGMQQQQAAAPADQAMLGAYAVRPPGAAPAAEPQQAMPVVQPAAPDMRFREALPQQPQPVPQAPAMQAPAMQAPTMQAPVLLQTASPQPSKPTLSYGDPFNNARFRGVQAPHRASAHVAGNAYGMPQSSPTDEATTLMSNAVAPLAQPVMSASQLNSNERITAPQLPRFREGFSQTAGATVGDRGNPNPSGVPMPFYSPNQAPPPAPNQLPSSSAVVSGVFPFEMQQATAAGVRPAMGAQAGLNTAAINFSPLGVHSDINAYPFSS